MGDSLGEIFTICPVKRLYIATSIEADLTTLTRVPDFTSRIRCPHCGGEHEWTQNEGWFRDRDGAMTPWPKAEE